MYRIKFRIKSLSPILFNAWTAAAKEKLDKGSTGGKMSVEQRIDEASEKVYRNAEGMFVPAGNLESCLVAGAKKAGLKRGRAGLAPYLEATVFIEERELSLGVTDPDGIHEVMGKRPARTGAAVIIRRPILNEWSIGGTMAVLDDRMDPEQIQTALAEAGLMAGLGDWRPKYGRFEVSEFAVV